MIYTKSDEIALVRKNLAVFEGRLDRLKPTLLKTAIRSEQHNLFFSLCNPAIYPHLIEAINSIKSYDKHTYFPKAVSKLQNQSKSLGHKQSVAEVIAAGHYFSKFLNDKGVRVEWEPQSQRHDISLILKNKTVNIEITSLAEEEKVRNHLDLRYKVKVELEKKLQSLTPQKYCYIFALSKEYLTPSEIGDFVDFMLESREKGVGTYTNKVRGKEIGKVEVRKLNKLKEEYAASIDIWSGFKNDSERLAKAITEKSRRQLPSTGSNFVFISTLGDLTFDDYDIQQGFWGTEQLHLNKEGDLIGTSRADDGAIHAINRRKLSPVCAVMYSSWDYSKKKIYYNPLEAVDEEALNLVL